jgi:hypothetical protein
MHVTIKLKRRSREEKEMNEEVEESICERIKSNEKLVNKGRNR